MKYLCKVSVSVDVEVAFDAEMDVEAEFEDGQIVFHGFNMSFERCAKCPLADVNLSGEIELEVEAENEEEAENIAIEQVGDASRWEAKSWIAGQNLFSTYITGVSVERVEVEEISG